MSEVTNFKDAKGSSFLPSNSAWPTPTIMMDIGSLAACKGKEIKSDRNVQGKNCDLRQQLYKW